MPMVEGGLMRLPQFITKKDILDEIHNYFCLWGSSNKFEIFRELAL